MLLPPTTPYAHHPVLLRRDAVDAGIADKVLHRMVRSGVMRRLRQGVYVDADAWSTASAVDRHLLLCHGVRRLYDDGVALSHSSAALTWGAPSFGLSPEDVHLTHLDGVAGRRQARVTHHRGICLVDDVTRDELGWITSPARTLVDSAKTLAMEAAIVMADWMLHAGLTTKAELWAALDRQEESPYTLRIRSVIAGSEPLTESVGESRTRYRIRQAGLPRPVPQFVITDDHGRFVARVDFAWPGLGVVLEFDGLVKYGELVPRGATMLDVVRAEKRRDRDLAALGWIVIRIEWSDLAHPAAFLDRLARVLSRAA